MKTHVGFARAMFDLEIWQCDFEELLAEAGFEDYDTIGHDHYDSSIEFYKVGNDARLSDKAQQIIHEAGFAKAYVNHHDGWETHYKWGEPFAAYVGWRRRRTENGFEVSYWPEGWTKREWLETGYITIVPEPTRDPHPEAECRSPPPES